MSGNSSDDKKIDRRFPISSVQFISSTIDLVLSIYNQLILMFYYICKILLSIYIFESQPADAACSLVWSSG